MVVSNRVGAYPGKTLGGTAFDRICSRVRAHDVIDYSQGKAIFIRDLITDLRFTLRLFRNSVGFSIVAILSLALGIGASSAIFSLVYAVLVDPYPYKDADRIVAPTYSDTRGEQGR